jgi:hypothetical protein
MTSLAPYIETIAHKLLGEPNRKFPSRDQWRYGKKGSLSIEITGQKQGEWFDHEHEVGGGPFALIKTYARLDDEGARKWIADELGIKDDPPHKGSRNICYNYVSEDGTLLFQVVRVSATAKREKFFFQRQPDGQGSWKRKLDPKSGKMKLTMEGARLVPYHLDRLVAARQKANGQPPRVFIPEGEKDADRVAEAGFLTTTSPGGGSKGKSKWRSDYNQYFAGFEVVVLEDNDEAGRAHARHVAAELSPIAHSVRIVSLDGLPEKGDVSDWIDRGGTPAALEALIEQTPLWVPPAEPPAEEIGQSPEYADDALALRFTEQHAPSLKYIAKWGKWLLWSGSYWQEEDTLKAYDLARGICREASSEVMSWEDPNIKLAATIASAKTVAAVERLAKADRQHATTLEQWNSHGLLFNSSSGRSTCAPERSVSIAVRITSRRSPEPHWIRPCQPHCGTPFLPRSCPTKRSELTSSASAATA